jgi:hypothetical protein
MPGVAEDSGHSAIWRRGQNDGDSETFSPIDESLYCLVALIPGGPMQKGEANADQGFRRNLRPGNS